MLASGRAGSRFQEFCEFLNGEAGLMEDGPERPCGEIAVAMYGYGDEPG